MDKIPILTAGQIAQKLKRMSYQVWENNTNTDDITFIGIEPGGAIVAENIIKILKEISPFRINYLSLSINKKSPLENQTQLQEDLNGKTVILVDDVANSGKTLLYALKPILNFEPKKIEIVVLVDRKHKTYPVLPDIIGHSVSTTLQDNIIVTNKGNSLTGAHLE